MKPLKVIAGNWKMHHGPEATRDFFRRFDLASGNGVEGRGSGATPQADGTPGGEEGIKLLIFPPQISLAAAVEARPDSPIVSIGAQNIHWEESGAFTGEISASMVSEIGASHVLVGHSERRHLFGETDAETARKVGAALKAGLAPVVCVGETLEERKEGRVEAVILRQLDAVLEVVGGGRARTDGGGADHGGSSRLLIAYEPVWAIGTGETATPEDAAAAHEILRGRLRAALGDGPGDACPILYGGSVKPENARELMSAPNVDGVLVGGASLAPGSFAEIAREGMASHTR